MEHTLNIFFGTWTTCWSENRGNWNVVQHWGCSVEPERRRFVGITCTKTAGMQYRISANSCLVRELGTRNDPFAVAVVWSSVTVSQLRTIDCTSEHVTGLIARGGGRIWLGVARLTRINPRKLFPRNFVKGQSAKILSLENLALYGMWVCKSVLPNGLTLSLVPRP